MRALTSHVLLSRLFLWTSQPQDGVFNGGTDGPLKVGMSFVHPPTTASILHILSPLALKRTKRWKEKRRILLIGLLYC